MHIESKDCVLFPILWQAPSCMLGRHLINLCQSNELYMPFQWIQSLCSSLVRSQGFLTVLEDKKLKCKVSLSYIPPPQLFNGTAPISRAMFGPEQRGISFGPFRPSPILVALSQSTQRSLPSRASCLEAPFKRVLSGRISCSCAFVISFFPDREIRIWALKSDRPEFKFCFEATTCVT